MGGIACDLITIIAYIVVPSGFLRYPVSQAIHVSINLQVQCFHPVSSHALTSCTPITYPTLQQEVANQNPISIQ